jgi:hypothetical protein
MPFKSRAQRRKFAELLVKGEITPETFEERKKSKSRMGTKARRKTTRTPKKKATR